jgi:glycine cleavage system H protein
MLKLGARRFLGGNMSEIKQNLKYAKTHEWLLIEDGVATIGLTDYAQDQLGELVYAEVVPVGTEIAVDDAIGSVESVKMASDVYSPVAGEVIEANDSIEDEPEQLNEAPYDTWLVKLKLADDADLSDLLDAAGYKAFIEEGDA